MRLIILAFAVGLAGCQAEAEQPPPPSEPPPSSFQLSASQLSASEVSALTAEPAPRVLSPTADIIDAFLRRRAAALADVGPTLADYLDRFNGDVPNDFTVSTFTPATFFALSSGGGQFWFGASAVSADGAWALWVDGTVGRYRLGSGGSLIRGQVATLEAGVDYLLGDEAILGVMFTADASRELSEDFGYQIGGIGWMAGPYAAVRFGAGVVLDAKFLWGRSANMVQPTLTVADEFLTERWLATVRLAGETAFGPVLFRPELAFFYFRETQAEYVETGGGTVPEQTIGTARLSFGPELALPIALPRGASVEPTLALQGIWDIGASQLSARLTGGLSYVGAKGLSLSLRGGIGGLFMPDVVNWNVQAGVTIPLN